MSSEGFFKDIVMDDHWSPSNIYNFTVMLLNHLIAAGALVGLGWLGWKGLDKYLKHREEAHKRELAHERSIYT